MDAFLKIWPVLAFMVVQTVTVVWWASSITQKVRRLEEDVHARSGDGARIASMEATLEGMNGKLDLLVQAINARRR